MSRKQEEFFKALAKHVPPEDDEDEEGESIDESDDDYSDDYSDDSDEEEDDEETEEDRKWREEHIVDGDEEFEEEWTRSECPCQVCTEMNAAVDGWDALKERGTRDPIVAVLINAIEKTRDSMIHRVDDEHWKRGRKTPKF
jgi:hypothetical protein